MKKFLPWSLAFIPLVASVAFFWGDSPWCDPLSQLSVPALPQGNQYPLETSAEPSRDPESCFTVVEGKRALHPVSCAFNALNLYNRALSSGDKADKEAFLEITQLLQSQLEWAEDRAWLPYRFAFTYGTYHRFEPPWYSGMAQGMALSVFARAYWETESPDFLKAANGVGRTLLPNGNHGVTSWSSGPTCRADYFVEEYPGIDGGWGRRTFDHTLNGFLYGALGLLDWFRLTEDPQVGRLFTLAAHTLERRLPDYDLEIGPAYSLADKWPLQHHLFFLPLETGENSLSVRELTVQTKGQHTYPLVSPVPGAVEPYLGWSKVAGQPLRAQPERLADRWNGGWLRFKLPPTLRGGPGPSTVTLEYLDQLDSPWLVNLFNGDVQFLGVLPRGTSGAWRSQTFRVPPRLWGKYLGHQVKNRDVVEGLRAFHTLTGLSGFRSWADRWSRDQIQRYEAVNFLAVGEPGATYEISPPQLCASHCESASLAVPRRFQEDWEGQRFVMGPAGISQFSLPTPGRPSRVRARLEIGPLDIPSKLAIYVLEREFQEPQLLVHANPRETTEWRGLIEYDQQGVKLTPGTSTLNAQNPN